MTPDLDALLADAEAEDLDIDAFAARVEAAAQRRSSVAESGRALRLAVLRMRVASRRGRSTEDAAGPGFDPEAQGDQAIGTEPALVCLMDLLRAGGRLHRFDPEHAAGALRRWRDRPAPSEALAGRLASVCGQIDAFAGDWPRARVRFEEALARFDRMKDRPQAARETRQTSAYLAMATIDDPSASDEASAGAVGRALGALDRDAVEGLLASPQRPFQTHLLMRWLVHRKPAASIQIARACRDAWPPGGNGHPWPMIHFYRSLLLAPQSRGEARTHLERALGAYGREPGPILRLQRAVLLTVAAAAGIPGADRLAAASMAQLADELPGFQSRLPLWEDWNGKDARARCARLLPFWLR